jgi:DNA-binding transcriptional ArsR family regulator
MNVLADLLSSKVKAEMFRLLFGVRDERLHLRELARQSGLAVGTVRQELNRLTRLGVVESETSGNRTYYRANQAHPLYSGISGLVLKPVGEVESLRDTLRETPVRVPFIYGPAAGHRELLARELDLMVIGWIAKRRLAALLTTWAEAAGRGMRFYLRTVEQFRRQRRAHAPFLSRVLAGPRLFIVGDEQGLAELCNEE